MMFDEDIVAHVRRKGDGKEFDLGLAEIRATDKKSSNFQLIDDYAVWLVNNRAAHNIVYVAHLGDIVQNGDRKDGNPNTTEWRNAPAFEAVAPTGAGVLETFGAITAETLEGLARRSPTLNDRTRAGEARAMVEKLFAQIHDTARRIQPAGPTLPERHDIHLGVQPAAGEDELDPRASLGLGDLLNEAVAANLRMSDRLVASPTVELQANRTRRERRALGRLVQVANTAGASGPVLRMALTAAMAGMGASLGSVVVSMGHGRPLREVVLAGRPADPLNAVDVAGMGSLAASLLDRGEPRLVTDPAGELLFGRSHEALAGIRGLVSVPFEIELGPPAMMIVYNDSPAHDFAPEDLEFAQLVAGIASLALRGLAARRGVGLTGPA
jgi:hypothetical protein